MVLQVLLRLCSSMPSSANYVRAPLTLPCPALTLISVRSATRRVKPRAQWKRVLPKPIKTIIKHQSQPKRQDTSLKKYDDSAVSSLPLLVDCSLLCSSWLFGFT
jgi:hypothetical protein